MAAVEVRDAFRTGLRPTATLPTGMQALEACLDLKPSRDGLIAPTTIQFTEGLQDALTGAGITVAHPWPQFIQTRVGLFLATASTIYTVSKFGDVWTLTPITAWDWFRYRNVTDNVTFQTSLDPWESSPADQWSWVANGDVHHNTGAVTAYLRMTALEDLHYRDYTYHCQWTGTSAANHTGTGDRIRIVIGGDPGPWHTLATGAFSIDENVAVTSASSDYVAIECEANFHGSIASVYAHPIPALKSGTGLWHVAEIGTTVAFYNGGCVAAIRDGSYLTDDVVVPMTGCGYNGRGLTGAFTNGGIGSGTSWSDYWTYLFAGEYAPPLEASPMVNMLESLTENHVWWSSIAAGDSFLFHEYQRMTFGPAHESGDYTALDGYGLTNHFFIDLLKRNELGGRIMPWSGTVLAMRPLGSGVMVYGSTGVAFLFPISEPAAQFGLLKVSDVGILERDAVGGDQRRHLWIDANGHVRMTQDGRPPQVLDLRLEEWVGALDTIVVNYDDALGDFYITGLDSGDNLQTFVYSETGLGRQTDAVHSLVPISGELYGILTEGTADPTVRTHPIDFGNRAVKTLSLVGVGMVHTGTVNLRVYYKFDHTATWHASEWVELSSRAMVPLLVSGMDFTFEVKGASLSQLQYLVVELSDRGKRRLGALWKGPV